MIKHIFFIGTQIILINFDNYHFRDTNKAEGYCKRKEL